MRKVVLLSIIVVIFRSVQAISKHHSEGLQRGGIQPEDDISFLYPFQEVKESVND
jgi:hypothetical protein